MQFKNIPKFLGHRPIFTEVIAKKNTKQTDKFTKRGLRNSLEWNHHKTEIFPTSKNYQNKSIRQKSIGEQTLKNIYTDEVYKLLLLKVD